MAWRRRALDTAFPTAVRWIGVLGAAYLIFVDHNIPLIPLVTAMVFFKTIVGNGNGNGKK